MLKVLCFCITLSFYTLQVKSLGDEEYTWEDYNGTIPSNAMPASDDPNNPVYIGKVLIGKNNCTSAIIPSETFEFCGENVKDNIKILTVSDKAKFIWLPTNNNNFPNINKKDLVRTNYQDLLDSYWYVGRMTGGEGLRIKEVDGTLEVSDIIYNMFFSSKSNLYVDHNFDALVHSEEGSAKKKIESSKTEQAQKPVVMSSEDLSSQPCPKISQTEIEPLNLGQPTADAGMQVAPKTPSVALNPDLPTVNANADFKVDAHAQAAQKAPPPPKAPATLNPDGQPTVGANADFKVKADAQVSPKAPLASKTAFAL